MKTLLVIHVAFSFLAIIKLRLIAYSIKRNFILVKKQKKFVEKFLEIVYSTIMMFVPPISLFIVFMSQEYLIKMITEDMVKKDA